MAAKIRAVLVGCGSISRAWLTGLADLETVDLVGLVDLNEAAAQAQAEKFALADVHIDTDLASSLKYHQPDVVFDCTVPSAHVNVTLTALAHGCHVLGEKPLADSLENAQRMVAAAQQHDRLYAVMQNRRFDPNIQRLSRFLRAGTLGPLTTVNSDFYIGAHFGGFRDHMAHVLILDMAIHTFDAARLISDADPVSVFCKEWNPAGSWYDRDASAVAIFEMSNGLVYTYRGSWCAEGRRTTWESDWRVIGQQGSLTWDGAQDFQAEVVTQTGGFFSEVTTVAVPPARSDDKQGGHAGLIADFIDCVRQGRQPETIASDNIKSLAMVFSAIESAETGQVVRVRW